MLIAYRPTGEILLGFTSSPTRAGSRICAPVHSSMQAAQRQLRRRWTTGNTLTWPSFHRIRSSVGLACSSSVGKTSLIMPGPQAPPGRLRRTPSNGDTLEESAPVSAVPGDHARRPTALLQDPITTGMDRIATACRLAREKLPVRVHTGGGAARGEAADWRPGRLRELRIDPARRGPRVQRVPVWIGEQIGGRRGDRRRDARTGALTRTGHTDGIAAGARPWPHGATYSRTRKPLRRQILSAPRGGGRPSDCRVLMGPGGSFR